MKYQKKYFVEKQNNVNNNKSILSSSNIVLKVLGLNEKVEVN